MCGMKVTAILYLHVLQSAGCRTSQLLKMLGGVSCLLVVSSTAVSQPLELLSEPDIFKV